MTRSNVILILRKTLFILLLGLFGCNQDIPDGPLISATSNTDTTIPKYKINPAKSDSRAIVDEYFTNLHLILLSDEAAAEIDYVYHFFVIDSTQIILTDEDARSIISIDFKGKLQWKINAKSNDYRYFNEFSECTFNKHDQQLVAYNDLKTYAFDLSGNPLGSSPRLPMNFNQMYFIGEDMIICSAQGIRNDHAFDTPKQLALFNGRQLKNRFLDHLPKTPNAINTGGYPEFSMLNGQIHYHATFWPIFYRIDLPKVVPAFTFEISGRETTEDVMRNPSIEAKLPYIINNYVPSIKNLAADKEIILAAYRQKSSRSNAMVERDTGSTLFNASFLEYDNTLIEAPFLYNDGYLLRVVPKREHEHLQSPDYQSPDKLSNGWMKKLKEYKDLYDGRGKKYLYLLKV